MIKRLGIGILAVLFFSLFAWVGCTESIEPGEAGVIVQQYKMPLLGGEQGVHDDVLGVGRHFVPFGQEIWVYPTREYTYTWEGDTSEKSDSQVDERISFVNKEGLEFQGDFGVRLKIDRDSIPELIQRYRQPVDGIIDEFLRPMVRSSLQNIASTMVVDSIYGSQRPQFLRRVGREVDNKIKGVNILEFYVADKLSPPDEVRRRINKKVEAIQTAQQRENELRIARAMAKRDSIRATGDAKARLVRAQAEARAIQEVRSALSDTYIQYQQVEKWDGQVPKLTGGESFMFNLNNN